jgi:hypothetical protein
MEVVYPVNTGTFKTSAYEADGITELFRKASLDAYQYDLLIRVYSTYAAVLAVPVVSSLKIT